MIPHCKCTTRVASMLVGLAGVVASAAGQCTPQWSGYGGPFLDSNVLCVASWDPDGAGPQPAVVVAGGNMQHIGSTPASCVALWNGSSWQPMGEGVNGAVETVTTHDVDGNGTAEPVIGGLFNRSGTTAINCVGVYTNNQWQALGGGVTSPQVAGMWATITVGPDLVIGGSFTAAGGTPARNIARWDGAAWRELTQDFFGYFDFASHNGTLCAAGDFPNATQLQVAVAQWDGIAWQPIGSNYPRVDVNVLATYRGQLVAAGSFTNECCGNPPAPGERIAVWNGVTWQPLGTGINGAVQALCVFDPDGSGPTPDLLIAGGNFNTAGGQPASGIAAWDGAAWSGLGAGTAGQVRGLATWNNKLVVAGDFFSAGGVVSPGVAFWGCPLQLPCYPNCDSSTAAPILNVADFVCFTNRFAAASPAANCDGSSNPPTLNVADFICFLNNYAAGCP